MENISKKVDNQILSWQNKWNDLTARELCILIIKFASIPLNLIGVRTLVDCVVTPYSFVAAFFIVLHNILSVYTAIHYWPTNKISAIQPFSIAAVSIPVYMHLFNLMNEYGSSNNIFLSQYPFTIKPLDLIDFV